MPYNLSQSLNLSLRRGGCLFCFESVWRFPTAWEKYRQRRYTQGLQNGPALSRRQLQHPWFLHRLFRFFGQWNNHDCC